MAQGGPWPADWLLSDSRKQSLEAYLELRAELPGKYARCIIADINQRAHTSHRIISANIPTLLTTSDLWNFKQSRPLEPEEYLASLGIPVFSQQLPCALKTLLDDGLLVSGKEWRRLAGNGMHLAAVGSVIMFALAGSELRRPGQH